MILKLKDISEIATRELKFYLDEGYTLSPTMAGSQGEIYKVDLFKDKTVIRIRIENGRSKTKENQYIRQYIRACFICVEKFDCDVNKTNWLSALWNDSGEELFYKEFYEINRNVYTDSYSDYVSIEDKKHSRVKNQIINTNIVIPINRNLLSIINSKKGYKTIKLKDIGRFYSYVNSYGKFFKIEFLDIKKQDLIFKLC